MHKKPNSFFNYRLLNVHGHWVWSDQCDIYYKRHKTHQIVHLISQEAIEYVKDVTSLRYKTMCLQHDDPLLLVLILKFDCEGLA